MKWLSISHDRTAPSSVPVLIVTALLLAMACRDTTSPVPVTPPAQSPPEAPPPPQTGTLVVLIATAGEDMDVDGYAVAIGARGASTLWVALTDSVMIAGLAAGDLALELTDVASNCWVSGGQRRSASIAVGGITKVAFAIICEGDLEGVMRAEDLVGVWEAKSWEFFKQPQLTTSWEDVIAAGLAGTLTVTNDGGAGIQWHWRETYRWWGPDRPTLIWGHAEVHAGILQSVVDTISSEFECDWVCDGPILGDYRVVMDGARLVVTRVNPLTYYPFGEQRQAWTRLVLEKVQ